MAASLEVGLCDWQKVVLQGGQEGILGKGGPYCELSASVLTGISEWVYIQVDEGGPKGDLPREQLQGSD